MIEIFFMAGQQLRSLYHPGEGVNVNQITYRAKKKYGRNIDIIDVVGYMFNDARDRFVTETYPSVLTTRYYPNQPEPYVWL